MEYNEIVCAIGSQICKSRLDIYTTIIMETTKSIPFKGNGLLFCTFEDKM